MSTHVSYYVVPPLPIKDGSWPSLHLSMEVYQALKLGNVNQVLIFLGLHHHFDEDLHGFGEC